MNHLNKYIEIISADYSDFDGYTERHHVIPSSWWDNDYIVVLPAKQHLLAHYHLHMAFPEDRAMTYALNMMVSMKDSNQRDFSIIEEFAEIYAEAKEAYSKALSEAMTGEGNSFFGRKHSAESRAKISANHTYFSGDKHPSFGTHHSAESKAKMSASTDNAGSKNPMYGKPSAMSNPKWQRTCIHCDKTMSKNNYTRWHGDNCSLWVAQTWG